MKVRSHNHNFSTVVSYKTAGEFLLQEQLVVVTNRREIVVRPLRMHFRKASPFGLVSMYRKNRDRHCAYRPIASIGG
ncbi:hypothetical protein Tco_0635047 [Tanacetum coccineum]